MIRPTFLAFETAKRALNVSQAGLDTVGHNIANVNTPGYTRQRVDQVSIHSAHKNKFQIFGARGMSTGQGSDIIGINQVRDPFLDTRYRNEAATFGNLATKSAGLSDLENVFDEIKTQGLSAKLQDLINEITKYAERPDSEELSVVVRSAAQQLTQVLNKTSSELRAVMNQQRFDLEVAVRDEINSSLERIAYLNQQIRETNMYGNPANELNDERNLLIDHLANYLPIRVTRTPEKIGDSLTIERVSIQLVSQNGFPIGDFDLVNNDVFNKLGYEENDDGTVRISLIEGCSGFTLCDDITDTISNGAIKGFIDILNGHGEFAGDDDNSFRGIPYYMKSLDLFASTFAEMMNKLNEVMVEDPGDSTKKIPESRDLFASITGSPDITASNITISKDWLENANFLTTTKYDSVVPDGQNPDGKKDALNDNLLRFVSMLSRESIGFEGKDGNGKTFTLFTGTFEGKLVNIQSTLGLDKKLNDSLLSASNIVISSYADRRDSISAVSIDEEAINMMTYQNYYNAAARYMTVLDEALGTIIQNMGVVGR